jgi:glycosyltransferase involved in cell wall biosynthesis
VHRLPPAHCAWFDRGQLTVAPYWVPQFEEPQRPDFPALATEFRQRVQDAVAGQLDGSKPACFLSGGTDSSTVAGMVKQAAGRAATYSIGFEAQGYDEMQYARIAAKRFGTEHHEYYVTPNNLVRSIPAVGSSGCGSTRPVCGSPRDPVAPVASEPNARGGARMSKTICYFVGTHGDWGGASRILFNLVRHVDRRRFRPVVMLSQAGPICQELDQLGVEFHAWPRHDYGNPLRFGVDVARSAAFLRRCRVDLIHLNHGCIGWRPAELVAAGMLRIPVLQHVQQPVAQPSPDLMAARLVLTCSDYLRTVCNTGPIPKRTVYDVVDAHKFSHGRSIRSEIGIDDDAVVFSFIGRTRRRKGVQMFVDLARNIDDPEVRFLVTGQRIGVSTDDSYSAEEITAMIAVDTRIVYLGFRPDIENVYALSDVVVVPSQAPEPCPAVLIESAASARPVIATRTGSTAEFVVDGETGFLVDPTDLDTMAERARRLLADAALRRSMGQAARSAALDRFVAAPVDQVQAIYDEMLH